jgi:serine protease Do
MNLEVKQGAAIMSASNFCLRNMPPAARRLTMLTCVAAIGLAVLLAGPSGHGPRAPSFTLGARAADTGNQGAPGFADLVEKVKPAVVSVRVKMDNVAGASHKDSGNVGPGSPADKFLRQFGFEDLPEEAPERGQVVTGEGSGFFVSSDGYAVTSSHVVDRASAMQVTTDDGAKYSARVVGTDPKTDVAVVKVDGKHDFPYVRFTDRLPRIGEWVLAVGNPFGLGGTVTAGIVSANGRDIGSGPYDNYIQIDAPINKGNSGGPAFDLDGNVIGVATAIFSPSGGSVGIGFEVPANTAKAIVAELKEKGRVTRAWMGVKVQTVTSEIADSLDLKQAQGALVDEPQPGSPAANAGLVPGDVITAMNGIAVKDSRSLARDIGNMAPGSSVKLDVWSNGASKTVTVTVVQMPDEQQTKAGTSQPPASTSPSPNVGLTLAPANEVARSGDKGVVIVRVDPTGLAADHGLQAGDVILDVSSKPVSTGSDVVEALADAQAQGKRGVLMRVKTSDGVRFVALPTGNG